MILFFSLCAIFCHFIRLNFKNNSFIASKLSFLVNGKNLYKCDERHLHSHNMETKKTESNMKNIKTEGSIGKLNFNLNCS